MTGRTAPHHDEPDHREPYAPDLGPAGPAARWRPAAKAAAVVLPVCLIGWLGWQAVANSSRDVSGHASATHAPRYAEGDRVDADQAAGSPADRKSVV